MTPNIFSITNFTGRCQYIFPKKYGQYTQNLPFIQSQIVNFVQKFILICVYFRGTIKSKKGKGDTDVQVKGKGDTDVQVS